MSEPARAYRPSTWQVLNLPADELRRLEIEGPKPRHIPVPADLTRITAASQLALISISGHPICQVMTKRLRSSTVRFNVYDFAILRDLGLAERTSRGGWHVLTDDGRHYAPIVARRIANEMGIHAIYSSGSNIHYRTAHCTCGWSTRLYSRKFNESVNHEVGDHYTGTYRKTVWTSLAWLMLELGEKTLIREIGPSRVAEVIARRRGLGVKPATVNRTVTEILRRIWLRAARTWEQDVQPIAFGKMLLAEPKERVRELRDHEEIKAFGSMRDDYRPALAFFLESGCRLREVVTLRWSDIDWTARTISIRGKGDKVRRIPLTSGIAAILSPLRGHHPEAVFTYRAERTVTDRRLGRRLVKGTRYPITYSGMKTTWRRYGGAAAGLDDFRLHDTRHTAATRLLRDSGNLKLVQKLLGHEEITTTAKYAHADDQDLREAMEAVTKSRQKSRRRVADAG